MILQFEKTYSQQVSQKMLQNGINYDKGFNLNCFYELPVCMEGRLNAFVLKIETAQKDARRERREKGDAKKKKEQAKITKKTKSVV